MELIQATDPLVGEAMAVVHVAEIVLQHSWSLVVFESDCRLLCEDIEQDVAPPCWKIEDLVFSLRRLFKAQSTWAIHWVPWRLNLQAHLLARWVALFGLSSFMDSACIPSSILYCDSDFGLV
ncbi:hypothetical protein CJ030_MR2G002957 [Morella rubra]|uniref:RNase H type-1 domain-containing protein n=1 Tax=Morella rubra TaxID=262757 RepID=A0A6A1WEG9_9ROSI|nr:hypothetical protein CJ030_MR2G002957 [Morella rubra]